MFLLLVSIHILVCIWLIVIVLLQAGKGSGLSGLFGGGSAPEAIFGGGGDSTLKKITTVSAVVFLLTSTLLYIYVAKQGSNSVVRPVAATSYPVVPATPPAAIPVAPAQSSKTSAPAKAIVVQPTPVKSAPVAPASPVPVKTTPAAQAVPAPTPTAPAQPATPAGK